MERFLKAIILILLKWDRPERSLLQGKSSTCPWVTSTVPYETCQAPHSKALKAQATSFSRVG
jgi:hypothetical protein